MWRSPLLTRLRAVEVAAQEPDLALHVQTEHVGEAILAGQQHEEEDDAACDDGTLGVA